MQSTGKTYEHSGNTTEWDDILIKKGIITREDALIAKGLNPADVSTVGVWCPDKPSNDMNHFQIYSTLKSQKQLPLRSRPGKNLWESWTLMRWTNWRYRAWYWDT
jgi:hypothetical protein